MLRRYPLDALQKVIKHAIELLPTDSLLADSVRLGIKRMLVPLEIIKAITTGESERLTALSDILRACCNPAKWGSKKPDGMRANAMMRQWLNRALATLPDEQLHTLDRQIGELEGPKEFTVLILDDLLATTYWKRFVRYAEAFDQ